MDNLILMMTSLTILLNGQTMMVMVLGTILMERVSMIVLMFGGLHGKIPLVAPI